MADYQQESTKDNPLVSLVVDPGEDGDSRDHEQPQREHQEQEVVAVVLAISRSNTDETTDDNNKPPGSTEEQRFLSPTESKPSPDDTLGKYSVRLKYDVKTQIGLFNGILHYQDLYGKSPFDDEDSMNKFFVDWLEVDEPLESIISVIGDLVRMHNSRDVDDVDNDLEREAFLLAERILNDGGEKSRGRDKRVVSYDRKGKRKVDESSSGPGDANAAQGRKDEDIEDSITSALSEDEEDSIDKDEEGINFTLELLQHLGVYVEETGNNPLESEILIREFVCNVPLDIFPGECKMILFGVKERYEQFKSTGKIGDQRDMSGEDLKLMELADNIWGDHIHNRDARNTRIGPNRSKDPSLLRKILTAILIYREAMLTNPFEDETAMNDVVISLSTDIIGKDRDEINGVLLSLKVAYEDAAALLKEDSIPEFKEEILGLAHQILYASDDSIQYASSTTVVHDAKARLAVYDEQAEQQPKMGSANEDNQDEEEDPEEEDSVEDQETASTSSKNSDEQPGTRTGI